MRSKCCCVLVFLSVLVASNAARAVVPDLLPVQGIVTDQAGKVLDGDKDIVFSFYSQKKGGTALWTEEWTGDNAVAFEDGFFTAYLGAVSSLPIDDLLESGELWLGIQLVGDTEMERLELASVPFALEAEVCRQIGQLTEDKIQTKLIGPSGASAAGSCNGTDKVKGIDPATGQILCGEDVAQAGSSGGTLTDVTGTSPIAVTGSGGVRNIAITENTFAAYSHSHTGYLSSAPDAVTTTNIANGTITSTDVAADTFAAYSHSHTGYLSSAADAVTTTNIDNGTLLAEDFASIGNCSNICTDANTTYTAGTGLTLTTTEFSVNYGTTATTAAAGNHAHTGYLSSAADAVTSANIANGTILTEDFGNNAVTNAKLATDSISSAKIIDGTITGNDLALGSIASAEILDGTITSADLGTLASIRLQTEETTTRGMTADNATHWVTLSSYPATCSAANRGEIRLFRGATVLWVPDCLCLCHQGSGYAWSCLCPSM